MHLVNCLSQKWLQIVKYGLHLMVEGDLMTNGAAEYIWQKQCFFISSTLYQASENYISMWYTSSKSNEWWTSHFPSYVIHFLICVKARLQQRIYGYMAFTQSSIAWVHISILPQGKRQNNMAAILTTRQWVSILPKACIQRRVDMIGTQTICLAEQANAIIF